ncbi:hypothetical protein D0O09_28800 [Pseudomonas putida]|nr:hypothetical protein D0O09_28800 [Pseudomonas putida]
MPRHGRRKWWVGRCGSGANPLFACADLFAGLPAPTGPHRSQGLCCTCGSGQAREEAGTGKPSTADQVGQLCAPSFRP